MNGRKLLVALMCDEMSIRKKVDYNRSKHNFIGYATCENRSTEEDNQGAPEAKNALVFMIVGEDFKIPVSYFLLKGLNSYERASLTHLVIKKVNDTGAKVMSLTRVKCTFKKSSFTLQCYCFCIYRSN